MKNKFFKLLSLAVLTITAFTTTIVYAANNNYDEQYYELNYKRSVTASSIDSKIKEYYKDSYPSYYGGIYLKGEERNIVIQIIKNELPSKKSDDYKFYNEIINTDSSIIIEEVDNSLNELSETNEQLTKIFSSNRKLYNYVTSNYVDVMNNSVTIELLEGYKKYSNNIDILVKNSNILLYNETKEKNNTQATIKSGGKIYLYPNNTASYCSMGFRVNYNGTVGYLTAGHCVQSLSSIPSGTVGPKQFANNQNYDYAFIYPGSGYTTSNNLVSNKTNYSYLAVVYYCPGFVVGTSIAKDGAKSGYTTGTITSLNTSVYYSNENKTIYGLVKSSLHSEGGDSGSPVFMPRTNANGGSIAIGVLSGGNGTDMYFTSINSLPAALQYRA